VNLTLSAFSILTCTLIASGSWAQTQQVPETNSGAQSAPAEQTSKSPPPDHKASEPRSHRFWFGGLVSYSPLNSMRGGTAAPSSTTTLQASSGSRPVGEGFTFHAGLIKKFSLGVNFIHRRAGYDLSTSVVGATTTTSTTKTTVTNITYERSNMTYWDMPILLEFQPERRWYYEGGMTIRHLADIQSWRFQRSSSAATTISSGSVTTTNTDTCCNETPATPAKTNVVGLVAGAGLHLREAFGLKVTPEIRYTRWLANNIGSGPAQSAKNQIEILFGIAF
jgi:hypothetical protein